MAGHGCDHQVFYPELDFGVCGVNQPFSVRHNKKIKDEGMGDNLNTQKACRYKRRL
jgi:hypothetical protein